MPISLHSAIVPTWLRTLNASKGWLDKAEAYGKEHGISEADMLELRLIDDMLPFKYQVKSMSVHSLGAIKGVRQGAFSPDMTPAPDSFDALRRQVEETIAELSKLDEAEMEGWVGGEMAFVAGERRLEFTADDFLLHFSHSNFHFHSSMAYAILRMKGVELGKRDFMGALPMKA